MAALLLYGSRVYPRGVRVLSCGDTVANALSLAMIIPVSMLAVSAVFAK